MKGIVKILLFGAIVYYFIDLDSENGFQNLFLPFVMFLTICSLAIKAVVIMQNKGINLNKEIDVCSHRQRRSVFEAETIGDLVEIVFDAFGGD